MERDTISTQQKNCHISYSSFFLFMRRDRLESRWLFTRNNNCDMTTTRKRRRRCSISKVCTMQKQYSSRSFSFTSSAYFGLKRQPAHLPSIFIKRIQGCLSHLYALKRIPKFVSSFLKMGIPGLFFKQTIDVKKSIQYAVREFEPTISGI